MRFQQYTGPGHGEVARGYGVLPLRAARGAQRSRRRARAFRPLAGRVPRRERRARAHASARDARDRHARSQARRRYAPAHRRADRVPAPSGAAPSRRWARMNAPLHAGDRPAPSTVDEYLFYQTVVGTLPPAWLGDGRDPPRRHADVRRPARRLRAQGRARSEAAHELDRSPNAAYEDGLEAFVRAALAREHAVLARRARVHRAARAGRRGARARASRAQARRARRARHLSGLRAVGLLARRSRQPPPVDYDAARARCSPTFAERDGEREALLGELLDDVARRPHQALRHMAAAAAAPRARARRFSTGPIARSP